jgi:hypothetical protein
LLQEVLADLRPNLEAQRGFAEVFGAAALDLPLPPLLFASRPADSIRGRGIGKFPTEFSLTSKEVM